MPLINILKSLGKSVLKPLGLTAATLATDAANYKKIFRSGVTTLIISNKEMNDIMKIAKSLKESGLLIKGVSELIKNESKKRIGGFLSMLLGTLGVSLLRNLLAGKGAIATSQRRETNMPGGTGEGTFRSCQDF